RGRLGQGGGEREQRLEHARVARRIGDERRLAVRVRIRMIDAAARVGALSLGHVQVAGVLVKLFFVIGEQRGEVAIEVGAVAGLNRAAVRGHRNARHRLVPHARRSVGAPKRDGQAGHDGVESRRQPLRRLAGCGLRFELLELFMIADVLVAQLVVVVRARDAVDVAEAVAPAEARAAHHAVTASSLGRGGAERRARSVGSGVHLGRLVFFLRLDGRGFLALLAGSRFRLGGRRHLDRALSLAAVAVAVLLLFFFFLVVVVVLFERERALLASAGLRRGGLRRLLRRRLLLRRRRPLALARVLRLAVAVAFGIVELVLFVAGADLG